MSNQVLVDSNSNRGSKFLVYFSFFTQHDIVVGSLKHALMY